MIAKNSVNAIGAAFDSVSGSGMSSLMGIVQAPWAVTMGVYDQIQNLVSSHLDGPKLDIAALEKSMGFSMASKDKFYTRERGVAVINVHGLTVPKGNLLHRICGAVSLQWVSEQLDDAIFDNRVKAVVLHIDSPGGTAYVAPELATKVAELAQVKPIVAYSDGMVTAAAYWVAAAANAVVLSGPAVHVGGIGIVASNKYEAQPGQMVTEVKVGRFKGVASTALPSTADGASYTQDQADYLYNVFVVAAAGYRGVTPAHCNERMAEGRVFIGQQAIDAGLADQFLRLSQLIDALEANPSQFAKRRRVAATRVQAVASTPRSSQSFGVATVAATPIPTPEKNLSKQDQANIAVVHAKEHGIPIIQALKDLGFAA